MILNYTIKIKWYLLRESIQEKEIIFIRNHKLETTKVNLDATFFVCARRLFSLLLSIDYFFFVFVHNIFWSSVGACVLYVVVVFLPSFFPLLVCMSVVCLMSWCICICRIWDVLVFWCVCVCADGE